MASIVGTMKALAAVNVRVFERAREAIDNYLDTVERGLQIALRGQARVSGRTGGAQSDEQLGIFVFGSVQGMCGQFNEHIAEYAGRVVGEAATRPRIMALGERVIGRLEDRGMEPDVTLGLAGQLAALPNIVERCIVQTERLRQEGVERLVICYNRQTGRAAYEPAGDLVLPIAERWIEEIREREWPTMQLPVSLTPLPELVRSLIRQYLFSSFYRAAARSLAAENAARLAAMQSAEKNIDERLEELRSQYNRKRQAEITEELLDIVSGYTALEGS
jgi:F-type H+-transporting ATPase subunit gamma